MYPVSMHIALRAGNTDTIGPVLIVVAPRGTNVVISNSGISALETPFEDVQATP